MKRRSSRLADEAESVDGRDNTTRLERGPQGSGGDGAAGGYAHSMADYQSVGGIVEGRSKRGI